MMAGARTAGYKLQKDFYPTPPIATKRLLDVETFTGPIWEPACGDGAISRVLVEAGLETFSTDLHDGGYGHSGVDFLTTDGAVANVVTNPPYNLDEEFAEHACAIALNKVCLLMRLAWLAGKRRKALFSELGLSRVWVFSGRLPRMHRVGYDGPKTTSTIDFAWFVFDKAHLGKTEIGWL